MSELLDHRLRFPPRLVERELYLARAASDEDRAREIFAASITRDAFARAKRRR